MRAYVRAVLGLVRFQQNRGVVSFPFPFSLWPIVVFLFSLEEELPVQVSPSEIQVSPSESE